MVIENQSEQVPVVELQTLFRFQNRTTGEVSNANLTAQQICRLLCPVESTTKVKHITAETNVLQLLPDGSYATWRMAKTVPVLKEACTLWYKFSKDSGVSPTPRTCRQLLDEDPMLLLERGRDSIQYSSECTNSQWKTLKNLPDLRKALEALNMASVKPIGATEDPSVTTEPIQRELEAFLSSTGDTSGINTHEEEGYESDGGSRYVKDPASGRWIHEKLAKQQTQDAETLTIPNKTDQSDELACKQTKKRKRKSRFSARKGRNWIYITGLPLNCTEEEVGERFQKAGILDLDPETQKPKIKLYRHKNDSKQTLKGDASVCFARPESVNLAITLFDGATLRLDEREPVMSVTTAKFEQHGTEFDPKLSRSSDAKRKVAKLATLQAMDWDEGKFNGRLTGGRKGLRIVVLKHMFNAAALGALPPSEENKILSKMEQEVAKDCDEWGAAIEKMTVFSKNPEGVVVLKFTNPFAASEVVKQMNGRSREGKVVEASFWDGKTDFTVRDEETVEKEAKERHEAFGSWLDDQELPEDLKLQTE